MVDTAILYITQRPMKLEDAVRILLAQGCEVRIYPDQTVVVIGSDHNYMYLTADPDHYVRSIVESLTELIEIPEVIPLIGQGWDFQCPVKIIEALDMTPCDDSDDFDQAVLDSLFSVME
jgi:hypothetical protein